MKATLASLILVIAFCGLAIAQVAPAPPGGPGPSTQRGLEWEWSDTVVVDTVWVTVVLEDGGKTRN